MLPAFDNVIHLEKQCLENSDILETKECQIELNKVINLENVSFSYRDEEHFLMKDLNLQDTCWKNYSNCWTIRCRQKYSCRSYNGSNSTL